MAQDFYAAFRLNGTDSLGINSISIDGINMAAVQALEKRTSEMKITIQQIIEQNRSLIAENEKLRDRIANIASVSEELAEIRKLKSELVEKLKLAETIIGKKDVALLSK
jgi:regulator of replication initiation timing